MAPWWKIRSPSTPEYMSVESDDGQSDVSKPFLEKANAQLRRSRGTKSWAVTGVVFGAILGVIGTLLVMQFSNLDKVFEQEMYHSPLPKFPHTIRRFSHDSIFAEQSSPKSDAAWKTLEGTTYFTKPSQYNQVGYVRVDGAQRWEGIEPGFMLPDGTQKYGISMSHQLHCLGAMRRVSFELLHGLINTTEFLTTDQDVSSPDFVPTSFGVWHLTHCYDYLRQALQCAGDTSVEWPSYFENQPIVVGWDVPHKCVDWQSIMTYMEENG